MFCNFIDRHKIFCLLQCLGSSASAVGLCMSSFSLSKYKDQGFDVEQYIVVGSICTTIIVTAIKDSLINNPNLFQKKETDKNFIEV